MLRFYFPTYSNGLKEIAGFLGFRWSGLLTSGLETIVWRHRWKASRDPALKRTLLDYNRQDCEALELLTNRLIDLNAAAPPDGKPSQDEVVLTSDMKQEGSYLFKRNNFLFPDMETINKAAYWNYQRERVYVKSLRKSTLKCRRRATHRNTLTPNTTIEYSRPSSCPTCKSNVVYAHGKISRIVVDLKFMRHGVKRWIARHIVTRYRCPSCGSVFYPPDQQWLSSKYGPDLIAYAIYQIIELRLPQIALLRAWKNCSVWTSRGAR